MSPPSAACTAPSSELRSQGWATAVGVGGSKRARAIRRSYFSVSYTHLTLPTICSV